VVKSFDNMCFVTLLTRKEVLMSDCKVYEKGGARSLRGDYSPFPVDPSLRFEFAIVDHGDAKQRRRATEDELREALAAVGKSPDSIEAILDHQRIAELGPRCS
jgi:hypothetical protein